MVTLTDKAAAEIKTIMEQNGGQYHGLRVFVAGGGCSGLQYGMQIEDQAATVEDQVFETSGVKVIVDGGSYEYLKGSIIDFEDALQGGGFKINNPNAVKGCGCGNSFATEDSGDSASGGCGSGGCGCGGH
jgi:iron-sulfur cluster assembly accessory protein